MIQEIAPHRYDNHYEPLSPSPDDRVFLFSPPKMLAREGEGREIRFPRLKDFTRLPGELTYLFSIDGEKFFLARPEGEWEAPGFSLLHTGAIRGCTPPELSFAAATAMQLSRWYRDNRFCGRCGGEMARDTKERMLFCPRCKNTVYPKISPCIITGITDGDRILLTKYARSGYNHYALVAGFCEIGESFEETLRREVAEEVGLEVENIRYWASQPWSFSDSLLAGFFCDVRGSRTPPAGGRGTEGSQLVFPGRNPRFGRRRQPHPGDDRGVSAGEGVIAAESPCQNAESGAVTKVTKQRATIRSLGSSPF